MAIRKINRWLHCSHQIALMIPSRQFNSDPYERLRYQKQEHVTSVVSMWIEAGIGGRDFSRIASRLPPGWIISTTSSPPSISPRLSPPNTRHLRLPSPWVRKDWGTIPFRRLRCEWRDLHHPPRHVRFVWESFADDRWWIWLWSHLIGSGQKRSVFRTVAIIQRNEQHHRAELLT